MTTTAPKSNAELQRAFRARQREAGNAEVRGLFAPPALHARIKRYALKLLRTANHGP
jgi:hypothetical protein